tara:strand:+ start:244 stop:1245 length:1002 start_codon:yes stop_codon:yes gene_type:complete
LTDYLKKILLSVMALRVLLADESSTIKKVFQLALQDYGVEVTPVALGIDVHAVSLDFQPDIIFADILLQKKNGYEVCSEMKADDQLKSIPVVLMWSGFMELDQDKFEACEADGQLEKPFDVNQLRKVVQDLVPKTKTQNLSEYLEFPHREEEANEPSQSVANKEPAEIEEPPSPRDESEDEFQAVQFKSTGGKDAFKVELDDLEVDEAEFSTSEETEESSDATSTDPEEEFTSFQAVDLERENASNSAPTTLELDDDSLEDEDFSFHRSSPSPSSASDDVIGLKPEEVREIVERLAPKIIEDIAWKVVPDLATQIIERELKKLLSEKEKEISP